LPSFLSALRTSPRLRQGFGGQATMVITVELRPPRAELEGAAGIDAWIDTYHAIRTLTRQNIRVMVTDSAVGAQEENNLRHLVANLGEDVARNQVVPFLTSKHSLEFCLEYADQAVQRGFTSLVVLGGDKHVGRARCVDHAWQLRQLIRARHPELELGGWANPNADPIAQVDHLLHHDVSADFFLTQIVSHHQTDRVATFLDEGARRGLTLPGVFGVFYYRSANPRTLETLGQFLPVPVEALQAEFAAGATPIEVCARTIRSLVGLGVQHIYLSNLPTRRTAVTLNAILDAAEITVGSKVR
jgi:5,10-methylenetetrahydrofolate reductase